VDLRVGTKGDNPKFWDGTEAYVRKAIENHEQDLELGVEGIFNSACFLGGHAGGSRADPIMMNN
jgi:hypothetical protein